METSNRIETELEKEKYLVYFKPSLELAELVSEQKGIRIPRTGLHTTLCFFSMSREKEILLIENLSTLKFNPFFVQTDDFECFDNGDLVLKLLCTDELLDLHKKIFLQVKDLTDFDPRVERYFWDNYNPHMTISDLNSCEDFDVSNQELKNQTYCVSEYVLARKSSDNWEKLEVFTSQE